MEHDGVEVVTLAGVEDIDHLSLELIVVEPWFARPIDVGDRRDPNATELTHRSPRLFNGRVHHRV